MYPTQHNKDGSLKHSAECKMAFGRKDHQCPRCLEMLNGAPSRAGWQRDYYTLKKRNDEIHALTIEHHSKTCQKCRPNGSEFGQVCTAFES